MSAVAVGWGGTTMRTPIGTGRQRTLAPPPALSARGRGRSVATALTAPIAAPGVSIAAPTVPIIVGPALTGRVQPAGSRASALRVTRAGRLTVTLLVALALACLGFAVSVRFGGVSAAATQQTITVRPGQTLSELAVTYLPDLSMAEGIDAIQRANRLQNDRIIAGDSLVIPGS